MRKFILFLAFILYPLLIFAQPSSTFVLAVSDDTSTVYTTHLGFVGADVSKLGYKGIVTITAGGAPSNADYLVGTANSTLSAEIVAGITPGGSLGGTWASPTIDDLFLLNTGDIGSGTYNFTGNVSTLGNVGIGNTNPLVLLDTTTSPGAGLKVLASGKVGIGTTVPAYDLDVTGDIRATGDIYSTDQYTVTGDIGALGNLGVGTTTPILKVDVRGSGTSIFGFVGGSMGIGNTAPQGLLDVSATTPGTGLVVLSTGRVGIGLTNPSVALDVSGTVNATTLTEGGNAVFNTTETPGGELGGSWGTPTVDSTHSGSAHHSAVTLAGTPNYLTLSGQEITLTKLDISDDTNATGGVGVDITANDFTFDATELTNLTWSAGGSALLTHTYNLSGTDPVMTFGNNYVSVSTGNLGVGNTAPQALLDVGTSPGTGLIVLNTGNVGIGTTAPGFKLDVVGAMRTDDTIPIMRLVIKNIDNTFNKTGAVYSTQKNMVITRMDAICPTVASGTSAVFSLKTVGTDGTGPFTNLSVGQTAPLAKLTVTSFTGGTLPAGYGLIIDDISQVGGTPPIYRLEIFGYEQ